MKVKGANACYIRKRPLNSMHCGQGCMVQSYRINGLIQRNHMPKPFLEDTPMQANTFLIALSDSQTEVKPSSLSL